jgi:3-deoxy-7-phosphoheptulonate synthase
MDNGPLLEHAARSGKPILLKRGMTATVEEVLAAVRLIRESGGRDVVVCERGSRSFEPSTRNSLDIAAVAAFALLRDFPVVVDPSHATGRADLVTPMARAAIASGADGLLVEVHPRPESALSDGPQSLPTSGFMPFMHAVRAMATAVGRTT